jgi:hypothetical protein
MSAYNSLLHKSFIKQHDLMRERFTRIVNAIYGKAINDQVKYTENFNAKLKDLLGADFKTYTSGGSIHVSAKGFLSAKAKQFKMLDNTEISVVCLDTNKIRFKRKGLGSKASSKPNKPYSQYSKEIKFQKELTPEKAAKYIIRFGTK